MSISREKISAIFLGTILLIVVAVGAILALSLRTDPVAENLKNDQVVKILFVLNDGKNNALSTDVFVYYPVSQKGALFNILGNTGAIYQSLESAEGRSGRVDRIDAVYKEKGINTYPISSSTSVSLSIIFPDPLYRSRKVPVTGKNRNSATIFRIFKRFHAKCT